MSLSKPYEGAGLGLSIAKAYVNMLGGKIWVNSAPNQGSSFHFSLSYSKQVETTPDQPLLSIPKQTNVQILKQLTVLAVEDDTIGRIYLSELLENSCKKILFATNGEEAIAYIKSEPEIDLILMDIRMPGMDGYTATRKIKEYNRQVVIIAQTAYALTGDRDKALAAGCDDYISKPFKKEELAHVIEKHFINKM
jgi:CheY-like chemotaxis protein